MSRSYYDATTTAAPDEEDPEDESGKRNVWEILSWIVLALTLILNLVGYSIDSGHSLGHFWAIFCPIIF